MVIWVALLAASYAVTRGLLKAGSGSPAAREKPAADLGPSAAPGPADDARRSQLRQAAEALARTREEALRTGGKAPLVYQPSELDRAAEESASVKSLRGEMLRHLVANSRPCGGGESGTTSEVTARFQLRVQGGLGLIEGVQVEQTYGPGVAEGVLDCVRNKIPPSFPVTDRAAASQFQGSADLKSQIAN